MKKRLILPFVTLGIASAMVAGGLLTQPRAIEAEPGAGGAVPSKSRQVTTASSISSTGASSTDAPSSPATTGGEPSAETGASAELAVNEQPSGGSDEQSSNEQSSSGNSPSEQSSPEQQSAPDAPETPLKTFQNQTVSNDTSQHGQSEAQINGWNIDYFDGFDASIESTEWERYGWGNPDVGHGAMGVMSQENSFIQDGKLTIRTKYENGQWSAGGAGSRNIFSASGGRWEVRAKFPNAKGIGYAFLLWPEDGSWPPEVDFAEGRVNGPEVMGVYHWDSDNKQEHRFFDNQDMSGWHNYGVIVDNDRITFTFDGQPWGEIEQPNITDKKMWVGFQTGAMDPNGWQNNTETVDGGVPNSLTPDVADIEIDHVAHYTRG